MGRYETMRFYIYKDCTPRMRKFSAKRLQSRGRVVGQLEFRVQRFSLLVPRYEGESKLKLELKTAPLPVGDALANRFECLIESPTPTRTTEIRLLSCK
jgi:hypothetical protein